MTSKCSVANCCLQSKFTFHAPRSQMQLELWKKILDIKQNDFYVCDQHFEDKFIRIEKRLTADAFPTQYVTKIEPGSPDYCQCCLKSFVRSRLLTQNELKYPVDEQFKEQVLDIVGIVIFDGVACAKCFEYIKQFQRFRSSLCEKQERRDEILRYQARMAQKEAATAAVTVPSPQLFDPDLKIKEEPLDEPALESFIDVQNESFDGHSVQVKEEVIDDEVVVKQEPLDADERTTFVISEVKSESPMIIRKSMPQPAKKIDLRSLSSRGLVVKSVNVKNLKVMPSSSPMQKFHVVQPPQKKPLFKTITVASTKVHSQIANAAGAIKISQNQLAQIANSSALTGFKCSYCPNRYTERRFVTEHIKQKHAFKCHLCPSIFPFKITLIKHQMKLHAAPGGSALTAPLTRHTASRMVCTVCACSFNSAESHRLHMATKHPSVVKQEKVDEEPFKINQTIVRPRPVTTLVRKILMPSNSEQLLKPKSELVEEDPDGIPCLDCGLLLRPDNLLKHRMDAHSLNTHNLMYSCDLCGIDIRGKTQLINHMTNKHLAKYFARCEYCNGLFSNQTEVICHKNLQHNFGGTRYTCHFCNSIFSNKRDMILHRKQHYSEKESRERLARIFCKKFKSYEPKSEEY